ncbi:MAG: hypothetical protein Tsb002_26140 [Wenzhouxiangellaceae bacterium]
MSNTNPGHQELELHNQATQRFIDLANELKGEGMDVRLVSAALMSASGVFATFTAAGNEGFLQPSGIDKIAAIYRRNLTYIQQRKREELSAAGKLDESAAADTPEERSSD